MKYPHNIKPKILSNNNTIYKNRGLSLENDLNLTNEYYRENNIAIVYKKPTPIRCVEVKNIDRKSIITKAFYEMQSTTDYNGIYKGKYIDFEAKEVRTNKSFSISNIKKHQLKHLFDIEKHGGISFIIVRFSSLDETYILTGDILKRIVDNNEKSISINTFKEEGYIIENKYMPRLDYIKIIDKLFFGGINEKN